MLTGGNWVSDTSPVPAWQAVFDATWDSARGLEHGAAAGSVTLPFEPLSFRDFMLYRDHYIGAARGYVRRFRPRVASIAAAYERTTRRTFPPFRPPALWAEQPIYYMSNARTFVPSGATVPFPGYSRALDWELELGFVIDEPLHDATPAEAEAAIAAFVVLNDLSARDVQIAEQDSGFGPQKAKHFMSSMSATAVTADEVLPRWREVRTSVTLNGEVVARPDASTPRFTLGEMLAHASASERLLPGAFFGTGTLVRGSGMEIDRWLEPGDHLRLEIEGMGVIEHDITAGLDEGAVPASS